MPLPTPLGPEMTIGRVSEGFMGAGRGRLALGLEGWSGGVVCRGKEELNRF